jgi:FecR protein
MSKRSLGTWLAPMLVLMFALVTIPAVAESHVRIVRLSDVQGAVEVDRGAGQGYEKAFLNMPMVEGMKLATKADGRAEVEFEDGSAVRITPNTRVDFSALSLQDSGARVSTLMLNQGMAYVQYTAKGKSDAFTVMFKDEKVHPEQPVRFRIDLKEATAVLAVFNGDVKVYGPSGPVEVSKNKSVSFDLAANEKFSLAKNIEEQPFDAWDKQQSKYQQAYASNSANRDYPYAYGVSDLNYYGSYSNVPGYGTMWQPYFAGVGWSPFADGSWMFYPGFGYTWVSAYPWGWMPYRYGAWNFVPGYGWGWAPGNFAGGWYPVPTVTNAPQRFRPPVPPTSGTSTVMVGHPTTMTGVPQRLVVQNGSAGLGVPRGSINNLSAVSRKVEQNGSATVHTAAPVRASSMPSPAMGNAGSHASPGASHVNTGAGRVSSGGHTSAPSRH